MVSGTSMTTIPPLTEDEIRSRVGQTSFQRGKQYFRDGAIFDARQQGMTLKARCAGSRPQPYRVRITFDERGIASANCSCPVGEGGYCKHTAALLLTWLERPEEFAAVEDEDTALERRSKEELIALVKQMLRQQPELESLLEVPLPTGGRRAAPVNPETYRRQAAAAFRRGDYEWGAEAGIADELLAITAIGDGFAEQQDYASAVTIYEQVALEVLEHYEEFHDESGDLGEVIDECVAGLGRCLEVEQDAASRERILHALLAIYRFDIDEAGGVDLGAEATELILEHATPEERRTVASWVREAIPEGTSWMSNWRRQAYGGFLLDLESDTLDDETFLQVCRQTGRTDDLVGRLLVLGRVDEATREAEQAGDYNLLELADIFVEHDQGDVAERLMLERSRQSQDRRVPDWLKNYYKARGKAAPALELAEKVFRMGPGFDGFERYKELRQLAEQTGRWDAMRPELLELLRKTGEIDLLVRMYLDEGEIDQALDTLRAEGARGPGYLYGYGSLALQVARAAEETRPRAALEIYGEQVERLIKQRGRGSYQEAARLLTKVRSLYQRLGEGDTWESYIAELRDQNRSLRALKEELAAAGL